MTDLRYGWLPERHLAVAATLSHADEIIGQIVDMLVGYQSQPDGIIGLSQVLAGTSTRATVSRVAPLPLKLPLLVADALVALRAALEHVLFAEVEYRDGTPLGSRAARLVEMPAAYTYENFEEWLRKRAGYGPPSLKAGSELVTRIKDLQPYQLNKDPQRHPLARLVGHTNHAKHRTPAVTAVRLATMYREDETPPRSLRDLPRLPETPIRVGDIIAETPLGEKVPMVLLPTIGINRPGTDRWPILIDELDQIAHWVRTQAVPRLVTGADPLPPPLPARYDIAVAHDDERAAIASGSWTTAAARMKARVGAASVRADMPTVVAQMHEELTAESVEAWFATVPDDVLVARMQQFQRTDTFDLDVMLRNVAVLESFRDDALAFVRDGNASSS
ncbi:hypothetical protein IEE94_10255 [Yimella sp. cx-573]|nr:hypothetical protein [Yimella sp. cx-573]